MPDTVLRADSAFRDNECLRRVTFLREGKGEERELVGLRLGHWSPRRPLCWEKWLVFSNFRNLERWFLKCGQLVRVLPYTPKGGCGFNS